MSSLLPTKEYAFRKSAEVECCVTVVLLSSPVTLVFCCCVEVLSPSLGWDLCQCDGLGKLKPTTCVVILTHLT